MKLTTHTIKKILTPLVICVFVLMIVYTQAMHEAASPPFSAKLEAVRRTLLPAQVAPYVTFGFRNILADYYWIQAVQDYVQWDQKDIFYVDYFKNISTLAPTFEYPYIFSIWAVPSKKNMETLNQVAIISDTGTQAIPTSWKIPFYLGTQYYFFTRTFDQAEKYLRLASTIQGAPDGVPLLYTSLVAKKVKGYQTSQELVKVIYNNTDNEMIKKMAQAGLQENIISQVLEKGIASYKAVHRVYPKTIDDLVQSNLIVLPKGFLDVFSVSINERDGSFKIEARE